MQIIKVLSSEMETLIFGSQCAKVIADGSVVHLSGELGVGKTTFVRGFLRGLGYEAKVKSPTYTLVEPYDVSGRKIFHFDFYRLKQANELISIGIQDYFRDPAVWLIEWPEKGELFIPPPDIGIYMTFLTNGRMVLVRTFSPKGDAFLKTLKQEEGVEAHQATT